jgi:hypothetical protein
MNKKSKIKHELQMGTLVQACNPSCSGGVDWADCSFEVSVAKSS